jgi:C4-dicarboxylate-specific signal transduction histidine kinase
MKSRAARGYWAPGLQRPADGASVPAGVAVSTVSTRFSRHASSGASRPLAQAARTTIWPYGIALCLVVAAFVSTLFLRRIIPYPFPFLFFAAVMASAWFGGAVVGLFSVLISTAVVDYFFVPPFYSFVINPTNATYFGAFVLCALVASWVSSSKKKSEEALREARDQLEARVTERTAELQTTNAELRRTMLEHDKAQQDLMRTQVELAHLSRVLSMGELAASIAHEVNQPLTAVVTNGQACLEWLSADPPNLDKARRTTESIIQNGTRAGSVLGRIRSLFKKEPPVRHWLEMNEVIEELIVFLRDEAVGRRVTIRTDLAPGLPRIKGDRVRLQQVVLNLLMNGMDALSDVAGRPRELLITSKRNDSAEIAVCVEDSGVGLSPEIEGRVFDPFFTTKHNGIGMGLSISRSIVESHGGRLWGASQGSGGAVFQFTLPVQQLDSDD